MPVQWKLFEKQNLWSLSFSNVDNIDKKTLVSSLSRESKFPSERPWVDPLEVATAVVVYTET